MKIINLNLQFILLLSIYSIVSVEAQIPYQIGYKRPELNNQFKQQIQEPNSFQINHAFSLSTKMGDNFSQTTGMYSNLTTYKISERIRINTGLHLMQTQNNFSNPSGSKIGFGYEFELNYKLNPNSFISIQLINYNNSPRVYPNSLYFNAP